MFTCACCGREFEGVGWPVLDEIGIEEEVRYCNDCAPEFLTVCPSHPVYIGKLIAGKYEHTKEGSLCL